MFKVINKIILFYLLFQINIWCYAQINTASFILNKGFTKLNFVPNNLKQSEYIIKSNLKNISIKNFCTKIDKYYKKYKWQDNSCGNIQWNTDFQTIKKHPLIYAEFGSGENVTLILGGVHGDELTTIPIVFKLANYINFNPDLIERFNKANVKVVIAPLVNPDGFLNDIPTRVNSNGVDLNRNFLTIDWYALAKKKWINVRKKDLRVYPGYFPNTEIEVIFQIYLIDLYSPNKIISLHSPLGFLDYDGPGDRKQEEYLSAVEKKAKQLVKGFSKQSDNYKVVDYDYYPGSLGNYAGNERLIPTITLELETSYPNKVEQYWKRFYQSLIDAVFYKVETGNKNNVWSIFKTLYSNNSTTKVN